MVDEDMLKNQLDKTLDKTNLGKGEMYKGKVRDNYFFNDKIIMITTDRISAFDHVLGTIPFKGQVLNQIAVFWFNMSKNIVKNHLISNPDPNVMIVRKCKPLPIEIIVRGYMTGSLWRAYEKGERILYGMKFNEGLKKHQEFAMPIITPSTKAKPGEHDLPITRAEIIEKGLVSEELYDQVEEISLRLFELGTKHAADQNLILVDTKYEFGLIDGELVLMDEIHTPDSSRFWLREKYEENFDLGKDQERLDKEHLRQWLIKKGYMGDGTPPQLDDEIRIQVAKMYIDLYERITGLKFEPGPGDVHDRIKNNLKVVLDGTV